MIYISHWQRKCEALSIATPHWLHDGSHVTVLVILVAVKSYSSAINRYFITIGGSRGGEKSVKDETKSGSSSSKVRDKGEEAMDWEADTKDVLEQLLRDDVTNHSCYFCTKGTIGPGRECAQQL